MAYVPSHERAGVSCRFAVSCRDGWVMAVERGSYVLWEVVGFVEGAGPTVLGVFEHGTDALALYNRDVRPS